jgi:hypothetical protein
LSSVKVFRAEKGDLVELTDFDGTFTSGDCYVVDTGEIGKIYVWLGRESSVDEKFITSVSSTMLDQSRGGLPDIDTVLEGEEPPELRNLFSSFKVVEGDIPSILKAPPPETFVNKMWMIEGETFGEVEMTQITVSDDNLDSGNVYIVETAEVIFLWIGKGASPMEKFRGNVMARKLRSNRGGRPKVRRIEEGQETPEFKKIFE